jgi:DNA polymerase III alpha subunit
MARGALLDRDPLSRQGRDARRRQGARPHPGYRRDAVEPGLGTIGGPFASVDDLWRRAGVPSAALVHLAEADAFRPSLGLARREALWAIKALRDEPLPLFAAASAREAEFVPEVSEPAVTLRPMTAGGEVVEDYGHVGLTLRAHPLSFLREDLRRRRIVTCAEAMAARDGRWLEAAGIVLVRQRPGSAKGVMFVTLEDETGIANLVIWAKVLEANRRAILSAGMMAAHGRQDGARAMLCIWSRSASRTYRPTSPAWAAGKRRFLSHMDGASSFAAAFPVVPICPGTR